MLVLVHDHTKAVCTPVVKSQREKLNKYKPAVMSRSSLGVGLNNAMHHRVTLVEGHLNI